MVFNKDRMFWFFFRTFWFFLDLDQFWFFRIRIFFIGILAVVLCENKDAVQKSPLKPPFDKPHQLFDKRNLTKYIPLIEYLVILIPV